MYIYIYAWIVVYYFLSIQCTCICILSHTYVHTWHIHYAYRCKTEIITSLFLLQIIVFKLSPSKNFIWQRTYMHVHLNNPSVRSSADTQLDADVTEVWLRLCQSGDFPDVGRWAEQGGCPKRCHWGISWQLLVKVWINDHEQHKLSASIYHEPLELRD